MSSAFDRADATLLLCKLRRVDLNRDLSNFFESALGHGVPMPLLAASVLLPEPCQTRSVKTQYLGLHRWVVFLPSARCSFSTTILHQHLAPTTFLAQNRFQPKQPLKKYWPKSKNCRHLYTYGATRTESHLNRQKTTPPFYILHKTLGTISGC